MAVEDALLDAWYGIDASGAPPCEPAHYSTLRMMFFAVMRLSSVRDFVDLGCGKGRACFYALRCGFRRATGVEVDPQIFRAAIENGGGPQFVRADAASFRFADPSVVFMFNPFREDTVALALSRNAGNIAAIAYVNDVHGDVVRKLGFREAFRRGRNAVYLP